MEQVISFAIVSYFIWRILETWMHRKERILMIQKLETLDSDKVGRIDFGKWNNKENSFITGKYVPLRWGLLIAGAALGMLLAFFIKQLYSDLSYRDADSLYWASTLLFGGIGLVASFIIEKIDSASNKGQ